VRLAVLEMMQGGSTPEQMRFAFVARVEDQAGAGKDSLVSGGSHASDISKRVIGWCDDMRAELSAVEVFGARGAQ